MAKLVRRTKSLIGLFRATRRKFAAEAGPMIAAAVSFYSLLTLLPLLLLAVAALGYVLQSSDKAYSYVMTFFNSIVPTSTFVGEVLQGLVRARGVIGWVGILSLLWSGSQFFVTLQTALDGIWGAEKRTGYIRTRVKALVMVAVFGLLLVTSVAGSSAIDFVNRSSLGRYTAVSELLIVLAHVVSVVSAIGMFLTAYKLVPDTDVRWLPAISGAVFAGITWVIAKELYRLYLSHFANFSNLYGSLGSIIILILWIYYSSVIMIFGAELACVVERGTGEQPGR